MFTIECFGFKWHRDSLRDAIQFAMQVCDSYAIYRVSINGGEILIYPPKL